jgi:hypothetical protein
MATSVTTYFIVQARCIDEKGQEVDRHMARVRGMTDSGRPGWSEYLAIRYDSPEEAKQAARHPYAYSVWDGCYRGGTIKVIEVTERIVVRPVPISGPAALSPARRILVSGRS